MDDWAVMIIVALTPASNAGTAVGSTIIDIPTLYALNRVLEEILCNVTVTVLVTYDSNDDIAQARVAAYCDSHSITFM